MIFVMANISKVVVSLNKKIEMLLDVLLRQDDYLTAEQLANMLGVTERSIRNYVSKLNQRSNEECLIESSNRGYRLTNKISDKTLSTPINSNSQSILMFNIFAILIQQSDYISYDFLAQKLHYSMESIRSKAQELFAIINNLDIDVELQTKIFTGIRLMGKESQKRLLLEQLVNLQSIKKQSIIEDIKKYTSSNLPEENIEKHISIVDKVFSEHHITMIFPVYLKIIIHMMILYWRAATQHQVVNEKIRTNNEELYTEYSLAKELLDNEELKIEGQQEKVNLGNYLISLPLNIDNDSVLMKNDKVEAEIEEILQKTESYYQIPIFSNEKYRNRVTKHILRLMLPLSEHIPIFNPLLQDAKREYLFAYSISCFLYAQLQKKFEIDASDSAILYLTIHVQLIIQEENHEKINTLLVFPGKNVQGELLRYKISTYFTNIEITNVTSEYMNLDNRQLVIIVGDQGGIRSNTIHISERLDGNDVRKIQQFLDGMGTQDLLKDSYFYRINVSTPAEVIRTLTESSGYSDFIPYIQEREKMSTTDIGNYVALPHPFLKGSPTQAKLIIGINKRPIKWGMQEVQLILLFIPDANLTTNEHFFEETYRHVKKIDVIQKLIQTDSKQDFIKTWNLGGIL